jgi:DNA-binding MarR family transcriptional regulator
MHNFCKLRDLYRIIQELENSIEEAHGLSVNECMTLCRINLGYCSSGELCDTLMQSKSRMSKILAGLEKKNFIERSFDKIDKRKIQFVLTSKGIEKSREVENSPVIIPDMEIKLNGYS